MNQVITEYFYWKLLSILWLKSKQIFKERNHLFLYMFIFWTKSLDTSRFLYTSQNNVMRFFSQHMKIKFLNKLLIHFLGTFQCCRYVLAIIVIFLLWKLISEAYCELSEVMMNLEVQGCIETIHIASSLSIKYLSNFSGYSQNFLSL